jgi:hypothetical protein
VNLFRFKRDAPTQSVSVVSLVGVVLIARPTAIFGSTSLSLPVAAVSESQLTTTPTSPVEKGTQTERLIAVGYVVASISKFKLTKENFQGLP